AVFALEHFALAPEMGAEGFDVAVAVVGMDARDPGLGRRLGQRDVEQRAHAGREIKLAGREVAFPQTLVRAVQRERMALAGLLERARPALQRAHVGGHGERAALRQALLADPDPAAVPEAALDRAGGGAVVLEAARDPA